MAKPNFKEIQPRCGFATEDWFSSLLLIMHRWSGVIDELHMYDRDRVLGDDQIKQLYDLSDISFGLTGSWKFEGDTRDFLQKHDGTTVAMLTSMVFAPDGRPFLLKKTTEAIRIMTPENVHTANTANIRVAVY